MTNTSVVVPVTPIWEFPEVPKPSAGGMTARTRLPTFLPTSADSSPGSRLLGIIAGLPVKVFSFSEEPVPSQKYSTKFAAMTSVLVRMTPVPGMSVLMARLLLALAFGMSTVGVLPNAPVAVTDEFSFEEEDDEDALDFDEPQPARTTQASRGTAMSARKRRMKTSIVVDVSFASLAAGPSGRVPPSGVLRRIPRLAIQSVTSPR